MKTFKTTLSIFVIAILMTSCAQNILDDNYSSPELITERVDMALEGAVEMMIHNESENGLISTYYDTTPFTIEDKVVVRIDLDGINFLELITHNSSLIDPLSSVLSYSAYPFEDLEDKSTYVLINYVNEEGVALYSTSPNGDPANIQPNVFEIRQVYENGFNARIRDLTLYEIGFPNRETARADRSITINGTFISQN